MFKKWFALLLLTVFVCSLVFVCPVYAEQCAVSEKLIRLHVVAVSDKPDDQQNKLLVRDAVLSEVTALTQGCPDAAAAGAVLKTKLSALQSTAAAALHAAGDAAPVTVTLEPEWFLSRSYDTFSLPAGQYLALRVVLGEGKGHNWWCVAFPSLCLPATSEGFEEAAAASGLTGKQTDLLTGEEKNVEIKFRTLEWLEALISWFGG